MSSQDGAELTGLAAQVEAQNTWHESRTRLRTAATARKHSRTVTCERCGAQQTIQARHGRFTDADYYELFNEYQVTEADLRVALRQAQSEADYWIHVARQVTERLAEVT